RPRNLGLEYGRRRRRRHQQVGHPSGHQQRPVLPPPPALTVKGQSEDRDIFRPSVNGDSPADQKTPALPGVPRSKTPFFCLHFSASLLSLTSVTSVVKMLRQPPPIRLPAHGSSVHH